MRQHAAILILALAAAIAAFPAMSGAHELGSSSPYLTVEAYNKLHPEQIQLERIFNGLVQGPAQPLPPGVQKKPVRIAVVYPGIQASDYWRRSVESFEKRMDELNIEYEVEEFFSRPVVELREQQHHVKEAMDSDPDYLIFTLDAIRHKALIERMLARKRPKVILQNITTPLKIWEARQPFMYVGFDHLVGTQMLADYFSKQHAKGSYGILYFGQGYVTEMRGLSFHSMLGNSSLTLSDAYYTDGDREKARLSAMEILKRDAPEFIYACSTDIALGALDALRESNMTDKVEVNGWGGGSAELEAIANQELAVTVMRMNDDNGVAMAEGIKLDIEGKTDQVPTVFSGEFRLVTKETSPEEMRQFEKRAFRYSGTR